MSLMDCPHCSHQISTSAASCPSCGLQMSQVFIEPSPTLTKNTTKKSRFTATLLTCLFFIGLILLLSQIITTPQSHTALTMASPAPNTTIEQAFNMEEGGYHKQLYTLVQRSLTNPNTLRHIETGYWDNGNIVIIHMIFQAQNLYGEFFEQKVVAEASINGDIWKFISPCPQIEATQGTCTQLQFFSHSMLATIMNALYELKTQ